jgi:hypothetical protein
MLDLFDGPDPSNAWSIGEQIGEIITSGQRRALIEIEPCEEEDHMAKAP